MESRRLQNGLPVETQAIDEILSMPFTPEIFRNGSRSDPFVNELSRIRHHAKFLEQKHRRKILNTRPQYEKEMESIKRKYDLILKIEDATFKKKKKLLADLRQKVERGISVDEELTAHFGEQVELYTSPQGQIPKQLDKSTVAQAPPTDQAEVRFNPAVCPLPQVAVVEPLDPIFDIVPCRNPESATGGRTGT